MKSRIFETYKNYIIQHGHHILKKTTATSIVAIRNFKYDKHDQPHWKYVLRCCYKRDSIIITGQELNRDDKNIYPTIQFMYAEYYHDVMCLSDAHTNKK